MNERSAVDTNDSNYSNENLFYDGIDLIRLFFREVFLKCYCGFIFDRYFCCCLFCFKSVVVVFNLGVTSVIN